MKIFPKVILIVVIQTFACLNLSAQHSKVNADKIIELIEQWNSIHNSHTEAAFVEVYENELFYYAERIPQSKATLLKKLLFVRNPGYLQRVSGPVKLEVYKNGIAKCDFNKEVWKNSKWVSDPIYLMIRYGKHGYWIMGESDYETDKRLGFNAKLGKPLQSKFLPLKKDVTASEVLAKSDSNNGFMLNKFIPSTRLTLFLIIALIGGGVVVILRNNSTFQNYLGSIHLEEPIVEEEEHEEPPVGEDIRDHEAELIRYKLNQDAFREYLFTLFDPALFKYEMKNQAQVTEKSVEKKIRDNKIHVKFRKSNSESKGFDVQYFYTDEIHNEVQLFSSDLCEHIRGQSTESELYIVIGMGGSPDDPNDIYLMHPEDIKPDIYSKEELQQYKKYGLFFFSQSQHQLC